MSIFVGKHPPFFCDFFLISNAFININEHVNYIFYISNHWLNVLCFGINLV